MWKWLDNLTCKLGIHDKMIIPCGHNDKEWCWFCTNCFKKCFAEAPVHHPKNNKEKSGGYWYGVEIPPAPPMPPPRPKGPPNTIEKEWEVK